MRNNTPSATTLALRKPLAEIRAVSGLTPSQAAKARGISRPSQHRAERGHTSVHLDTLIAAAADLGVELTITAKRREPADECAPDDPGTEARRLLARIEWADDARCPECKAPKPGPHTPDCDLDRLALRDGAT